MVNDPTQAYFAAHERFTKAEAEAQRIVDLVYGAASRLHSGSPTWRDAAIIDPVVQLPTDFVPRNKVSLAGWPTSIEIANALAEYQHAVSGLRETWKALPEPQQKAIPLPHQARR